MARDYAEEFLPSSIFDEVPIANKEMVRPYIGQSLQSALKSARKEILLFGGDYSTVMAYTENLQKAVLNNQELCFYGIARVTRDAKRNFDPLIELTRKPKFKKQIMIRH